MWVTQQSRAIVDESSSIVCHLAVQNRSEPGVLYGTEITKPKNHCSIYRASKAEISNLETYSMHKTHRYIASLFLTAALAAPVSILAASLPQEAAVQVRVYDKDHKDYHNWDDHENQQWGVFLTENHRNPHEFSKANKKEQSEYWNWRHAHPDKDNK